MIFNHIPGFNTVHLTAIQGDESEFAESEEDNEIFAISSMHCCLGLFAERFGLLPGSKLTARASAQSLAVACLAKLTLTLPPDVFFEPLQIDDNEDVTTGSKSNCLLTSA